MNKKKSFLLLELIIVISFSSIIIVYTLLFAKNSFEAQKLNQQQAILKLDLNSSKIFLSKHLLNIKNDLSYLNKTLYFKNSILLKNVNSFSLEKIGNFIYIEILLNKQISQKWVFKL